MMRLALTLVFCSLTAFQGTHAQTTDAARADGKAFGTSVAPAAQAAATTEPTAEIVPNFDGVPDQSRYFDAPDRMTVDAGLNAPGNEGYRTMRSSIDTRARFAPGDIALTTQRGRTIAQDPMTYTSGMSTGGGQGRCVPLPPGNGGAARYTATCNTGYKAEESTKLCPIALVARATTTTDYLYLCSDGGTPGGDCTAFQIPSCTHTGTRPGRCLQWSEIDGRRWCTEPGDPVREMTCSAPVPGQTPESVTPRTAITTTREESACTALASDATCTAGGETCTDSDPVTRTVDGVAVTQPCWAWTRTYQCRTETPAQDCDALAANGQCRLLTETCLTGEEPCKSFERQYDCPVPAATGAPQQYICDGDVYCIEGACETIDREPNDEFKDAVTALNAANQARREFDPANLQLFKGTRNSCKQAVFGLLDCCRGRAFPLLPGGPILLALGCAREEALLDERDRKGLCAYVGPYCSESFLGICLTKRKVYCCFESKLSRILQEQGRAQLGKRWASPKTEQCRGFTIDEFARLDLSRMDFSEVYAEFTDAAKLPDELEATAQIQQKIEAYYAAHRN